MVVKLNPQLDGGAVGCMLVKFIKKGILEEVGWVGWVKEITCAFGSIV